LGHKSLKWTLSALVLPLAVAAERVDLQQPGNDLAVSVLESNGTRTVLQCNLGSFEKREVVIDGDTYYKVELPGETHLFEAGRPELPIVARSVIIPEGAPVRLNILDVTHVDFTDFAVVPSKGPIPTNVDPDQVAYSFGDIYVTGARYPDQPVKLKQPFVIRDYRGVGVQFQPFQYSHAERTLRVYTSITVEVVHDVPGRLERRRQWSATGAPMPEFERMYQDLFVNYESHVRGDRAGQASSGEAPGETGEMLIIVYDAFAEAMAPFVEWKRQKGMKVNMVPVSEIYEYQSQGSGRDGSHRSALADFPPDTTRGKCCYGDCEYDPLCAVVTNDSCDALGGTWSELPFPSWSCDYPGLYACEDVLATDGIAAYIQDYYDSLLLDQESPELAYVLLVGDSREISPYYYTFTYWCSDHHQYEQATTPTDYSYALVDGLDDYADIIVGRFSAETIEDVETQVERTLDYEKSPVGGAWFSRAAGIARELHISRMNSIRSQLLNSTYDEVLQVYGDDIPHVDTRDALNSGISLVNYAGHGSVASWVSANFGSGAIYNLTNIDSLPVIMSVSCSPGDFDDPSVPCFGETWLRASDAGGDPVGAVGTYFSSFTQWSPPATTAQDYYNMYLVIGSRTSFGGLCYAGTAQMMNVTSGGTAVFHARNWVLFGDPSLLVRTDQPLALTVLHPGSMFYADAIYSAAVESGGSPVEGVRCTLYGDGLIYGSDVTGPDGTVDISISQSVLITGPLTLTATGINTETVQEDVNINHDLVIVHTPLEDVRDTVQPYVYTAEVLSGSPLADMNPRLWHGVIGQRDPIMHVMPPTGNPSEYQVTIPHENPGDTISYRITAENIDSDYDETGWLEFTVIAYDLLLTSAVESVSQVYGHNAWVDVTVTNNAVLDDSYQLSASSGWPTLVFDETGTNQITSTPLLQRDFSYTFKVRVTVDSETAGAGTLVSIEATSSGDPTVQSAIIVAVESEGTTLPLPFADSFDVSEVDSTYWHDCDWLVVTDEAMYGAGAPAAYSVKLFGSDIWIGDKDCLSITGLTSRRVDLGNRTDVYLAYWYERAGPGDPPEYGDDLIIEYVDADGLWHELTRQPGYGPAMVEFAADTVAVPGAGLHPSGQIRFRAVSDVDPGDPEFGSRDVWYVDNISIFTTDPTDTPVLAYPPDGTESTGSIPWLRWFAIPGVTEYEVIVDNDTDFSSPHANVLVTDTCWQVTPSLAYDTYYWKVKAYDPATGWSDWSETWSYRRKTSGGSTSCPVLFAHDGEQFRQENPLLTACEATGYREVVTDYYHLKTSVAAPDGLIRLELREMEDEITYLEAMQLIAVDHDVSTQVGVSAGGEIFSFTSALEPLAAVDQKGVDQLGALKEKDGYTFQATESGYLIVTFQQPVQRAALHIEAVVKPPCPRRDRVAAAPEQPRPTARVALYGGEDLWLDLPELAPREVPGNEYVMIDDPGGSTDDQIVVRLEWDAYYETDFVRLVLPAETPPAIEARELSSATLLLSGSATKGVIGFNDENPLVMRDGDILKMEFDAGDSPAPGEIRDYVILARGRYEPDPALFGNQLPGRFHLFENYPDPFNPGTTIEWQLPAAAHTTLDIFNIIGQRVRRLVDEVRPAGCHLIWWDGRNDDHQPVASGVYFYRLSSGDRVSTKKMMLLK